MKSKYVPSILAAIGNVVELHMKQIGYMDVEITASDEPSEPVERVTSDPCQNCGSFNVKNEGGCFTCNDCGHSKCG